MIFMWYNNFCLVQTNDGQERRLLGLRSKPVSGFLLRGQRLPLTMLMGKFLKEVFSS